MVQCSRCGSSLASKEQPCPHCEQKDAQADRTADGASDPMNDTARTEPPKPNVATREQTGPMSTAPPTALSPGMSYPNRVQSAPAEPLNEELTVKRNLRDLLGDIERSLTVDEKSAGDKANLLAKLGNLEKHNAAKRDTNADPTVLRQAAVATGANPRPIGAFLPGIPAGDGEQTMRMVSTNPSELAGPDTLPRGAPPAAGSRAAVRAPDSGGVDASAGGIHGTLMMPNGRPASGVSNAPAGVSTDALQIVPSSPFSDASGQKKSPSASPKGRTEPLAATPMPADLGSQSPRPSTPPQGANGAGGSLAPVPMTSHGAGTLPLSPGARSSGSMELPGVSGMGVQPNATSESPPSNSRGRLARMGASVFVLAVICGAGAAWYKRPSGIAARAVVEATGDRIELTCASCASGTTVRISGTDQVVNIEGGVAKFAAPALQVGQNQIKVHVERPRRAPEDTTLSVPLAYRVTISQEGVGGPQIVAELAPLPGAKILLDDKELPIGPDGFAKYTLPPGRDSEGESPDAHAFIRDVHYAYTAPGRREVGLLKVPLTIAPLVVNHSSVPLRVTRDVVVEGKTTPLAEVMISGLTLFADESGRFSTRISVPETTEPVSIDVMAQANGQAPRSTRLTAFYVPSLDAAAKAADAEQPLTFPDFEGEAKKTTGKTAYVEGRTLAITDAEHGVGRIAEVDVQKGCARGVHCRSHVRLPPDAEVEVGTQLRAYGVLRAYTAGEPAVGDIDASFVLVK